MSQRKPNRKAWYSLAVVMLLCAGILVLATGTAYARYRAEREKNVTFEVRQPNQIYLGTVDTVQKQSAEEAQTIAVEVFTPQSQLRWQTEDAVTALDFAVANGQSDTEFSPRDQVVRVRMIGTLGLLEDETLPALRLTFPKEAGSEETAVVTAKAEQIKEGTTLHLAYGDGWLYTFEDEEEEELFWELPGEALSYITLNVTIQGEVPENLNLLQPLVVAEALQD